jgi:hypothetical protein
MTGDLYVGAEAAAIDRGRDERGPPVRGVRVRTST